GEGQIEIWLNDTLIHVIDLTANDNGNGNDWSTVSHVEIDPVQIEQGDVITLRGVRDAWEMARIDNIAFCPQNNTAPVAEDDAFTVGETSSTVLDLLSNDFDPEGDDLTITLLSQPLDGMVSIDANGQVVFETGDSFQGLSDGQTATVTFEYQISDGELTDTATVTVTVVGEGECIDSRTDAQVVTTLPGGSAVTTTFTGPEVVKHDTDSFDVAITFGDITQEQYNFVFVLDVSGSTGVADSFEVGKTVLEAEIEAVKSLTASIIDAGIPDGAATISIIPFSSPDAAPGGQFPVFTFGDDGNGLLQSDIDAALDALTFAGETNYLAAIGTATDTVQNLEQRFGDANNQMYFLSDGDPTPPGSQPPFLLDIFSANLRSQAEVHAIGLGTDVSTTYLDPLDNTGGAEIALDTAALTAAINQAPESIPDIVDASLVLTDVNGATLQTFDFLPTDFEETALGYELSIDNVSGLGMFVGDTTDATLSISYDEDGDGLTDEVANIMLSLDGILPQSIDL
ncbi:MAG: Ig-like domain-containing protein, partial [Pseudomonadota bacterium]